MAKYQLRTFYTATVSSVVLSHQLNVFVNVSNDPSPGTDFADIDVSLKGAGTNDMSTYLGIFLPFIRAFYHTTCDFVRSEIWRADDADSEDYTYIGTEAIGLQGLSGNAVVVAQQNTITFRSVLGKSSRVQLMESSLSGTNKEAFPTGNAGVNSLATHMTGSSSAIVTRHGDFLVVGVNLANGQNERLARRRFRST